MHILACKFFDKESATDIFVLSVSRLVIYCVDLSDNNSDMRCQSGF